MDVSKNDVQILELYAGERRLAKLATSLGLASSAMDRDYDSKADNVVINNSMDINTSGGFVFLITCISINGFVKSKFLLLFWGIREHPTHL